MEQIKNQVMSNLLENVAKNREIFEKNRKEEEIKAIAEANIKKEEEIRWYNDNSNIPKRYKNAKFSPFPVQKETCRILTNFYSGKEIKDFGNVLLLGGVGAGKTYLACGLANYFIQQKIYCKFTTESDLLDLIHFKEFVKYKSFKTCAFLIIDELATWDYLDWQKRATTELISYRYDEMLPTFLISNLSIPELKQKLGDRLLSRLSSALQITFNHDIDLRRTNTLKQKTV